MTESAESLPRTTIGQLVYPASPRFSFARLVADLDGALAGTGVPGRRLCWDHDDVAIIDIGGSRIALCLADGLGQGGATAVTVAAGYGPDPGDTRLAERQAALARLIAERIAARFPPAETIWTASEETASPDLFDALNEALVARLNAEAEAERRRAARPQRVERRRRLPEGQDVGRMMARLEATLAARQAGRPDPEPEELAAMRPGEPANREPDLPRRDDTRLRAVREALYAPGDEAEEDRPSAAMRLAAHAMDATLLVVALPVGAAMMTYSLARGADLKRSARMLALGGIWVGALGAAGGLSAIVPVI